MRLRLMAAYLGVPYQAGLGPDGMEATLFSPGPPPEELGFTAAAGHWRKQVSITDLDALWQSRPVGDYRGEPCLVLDDLGDRLHIAYLGRDAARAAQLGYWEIDREVFEVVVARSDITELNEERVDFPLTAAMFPAGRPAMAASEAVPTSGSVPTSEAPAGAAGTAGATGAAGAAAGRTGYAGPAGYAGANGYPEPAGNTGLEAYRGTRVNGGMPGNSRPTGYGGTGHVSHMPDRMAAWHGSPEPWPGPPASPENETGPGAGEMAEGRPDPEFEAGPEREPRAGPWVDPRAGSEPRVEPWAGSEPWADPWTGRGPGSTPEAASVPGRRTGRKERISPESVFAELLSLAAIPQAAYAVDEEVPGAMCLVEADGGFEVFSRTEDARLEVHFFEDEEAAYFYLFGVLAAEAVRSGRLRPNGSALVNGSARVNGQHNGSGPATPSGSSRTSPENVSKYLRGRKLPTLASHPARVLFSRRG